ncbi:MAG: sugar ABC transporter substrate-binding protein, partial [Thermoplasmata archaeon]
HPVYGFAYGLGTDSGYRSAAWFPAFGGQIFNSAIQPELNSPQDIAAISFLYNLTYVYHVSPKGLKTMPQQYSLFENNETAFMVDGPWDQSVYSSYLGSNLGVAPLPYNNMTGDWPEPIWGSIGYSISTPKASGATQSQIWASIQFVKYETNYTAQLHLFEKAGDFPSLKSVGNYISTNTTIESKDPLISGWVAQEAHTQIDPSYVQMNYYWPNFATYVGNLYDNGTNNVTSAMNAFQKAVENDISPPTPTIPSIYYIIAGVVAAVVVIAGVASYYYVSKKKTRK